MKKSALWVMLLALCGLALAQGMKKDEHPMGDKKMGGRADHKMGDKKMAAMADHRIVQPKDVQWGDPPPALPAGAKLAVLEGDPNQPGPFIIRLKAPNGYRVMPHWHPAAEYVTVISGSFSIGMGDKWDDKAMTRLGPGSYISLNAQAHHFAATKGPETIVQVNGMGPFVLNYVNPKDDPSKQAAKPAAAPAKQQ